MKAFFSFLMTLVASVFGGSVAMAAGSLPDGGTTDGGYGKDLDSNSAPTNNNQKGDGIATTTENLTDGDSDFLDKEIDRKITKIRPMSTPIDQISRYAESGTTKQFAFKYFSVGTRPIKTTLAANITAAATANVKVTNPEIFTVDDTLRIVGEAAKYNYKGQAYSTLSGQKTPDLVLKVAEITSDGTLKCFAVNGNLDSAGQPSMVPAVTLASTPQTVIRMGKACGELDVQTGRFANIPTATDQYCQNFLMQVEQSTFDKISAKNVDWNFSDLEEDGVYDMRLGMEGSFLFGDMGCIKHVSKNNMATWFTKGIWWQAAGTDIEVGTYDSTTKQTTITDDDLVDIAKDLFVGTGSGTKRKVMFCGSEMLAALSKIDSDKFRLKENVEAWDLKFKSWDTDFGEILTIHHELFDLNGMADCALCIDPEYLGKKKFISWTRNVLDLKTAGVRNTEAVVLQEASALYLRYPKAHFRMQLAKSAGA
jgi:hypothetical protein